MRVWEIPRSPDRTPSYLAIETTTTFPRRSLILNLQGVYPVKETLDPCVSLEILWKKAL